MRTGLLFAPRFCMVDQVGYWGSDASGGRLSIRARMAFACVAALYVGCAGARDGEENASEQDLASLRVLATSQHITERATFASDGAFVYWNESTLAPSIVRVGLDGRPPKRIYEGVNGITDVHAIRASGERLLFAGYNVDFLAGKARSVLMEGRTDGSAPL